MTDSFPFGRNKFLSLPPARRQKWIAVWLKDIYQKLLEGRLEEESFRLFSIHYSRVLSWLGTRATIPDSMDERERMEFIAERFHSHRKKTGLGTAEADFLPRVKKGDVDLDKPWRPSVPYKAALDNLRSAFNAGSIFRLVDAAGFEGVISGARTPGKDHPQTRKTAMGSSEWIPEEKSENLALTLKRLKLSGYKVIGLETVEGAPSYLDFAWPEKGVIALGNEEYGLSREVMKVCDDFAVLPMRGKKNSINVANAFAVVAFHVCSSLIGPEQRQEEKSRAVEVSLDEL